MHLSTLSLWLVPLLLVVAFYVRGVFLEALEYFLMDYLYQTKYDPWVSAIALPVCSGSLTALLLNFFTDPPTAFGLGLFDLLIVSIILQYRSVLSQDGQIRAHILRRARGLLILQASVMTIIVVWRFAPDYPRWPTIEELIRVF